MSNYVKFKILEDVDNKYRRSAKIGRIAQRRVPGHHSIIHQGTGAFPVEKMCERGHMRSFGSFEIF